MASSSGTGAATTRGEEYARLLAQIEGDTRGTLTVSVEHGHYQSTYESDGAVTEGDWKLDLVDALRSLIGYLDA